MKNRYALVCGALCGNLLMFGMAHADTLKVPVNAITDQGVAEEIGTITFVDADGNEAGVDILVELTGLPEGEHGMHIHENASCEPAESNGKMTAGMAAGGHLDPAGTKTHAGPEGKGHKGDLPRIRVDAEGAVKTQLHAPQLKTADLKGHSVMIHAGGDNYSDNPPMGGGGARIACGVIR